jgi:hypothetical protein
MTTLRSFQAEIESLTNEKQQQALERAREAHATAELAKHKNKADVKVVPAPTSPKSPKKILTKVDTQPHILSPTEAEDEAEAERIMVGCMTFR